jgi:hypothetical protein
VREGVFIVTGKEMLGLETTNGSEPGYQVVGMEPVDDGGHRHHDHMALDAIMKGVLPEMDGTIATKGTAKTCLGLHQDDALSIECTNEGEHAPA